MSSRTPALVIRGFGDDDLTEVVDINTETLQTSLDEATSKQPRGRTGRQALPLPQPLTRAPPGVVALSDVSLD